MIQEPQGFYPVRTVSRAVAKKRAARLRTLWFVVGTGFGIGCGALVINQSNSGAPAPDPQIVAAPAPVVAPVAEPVTAEVALINDQGVPVDKEPEPAAVVAAAAPVPTPIPTPTPAAQKHYPLALELKVANGDTMITLLTDAGVSQDEAYNIVQAMGKNFNPKQLNVGKNVSVVLDKTPADQKVTVVRMIMPTSVTTSIELTRSKDNDFSVKKLEAPVETKLARAGGKIDSSLYETGLSSGIPAGLINELINAYSYDVDFQRDIKDGDAIDVLYERVQTKEGAIAGYGNVIYADLDLGGRSMKIYRYTDKSGNSDYYNLKGESVRKALLRTPINGARITSKFGMRNHPILGYSKMHRGVDFGAPAGTPIYAAGDGTIEMATVKGGYGNYIRLRHNNTYATAYGHISRFAAGISAGKKVRQGQVIAYVGSTGQSTGPHLHYEVLQGNSQVNPSGVKFKTGAVLKGTELASFRKNIEKIEVMVNSTPRGVKMAMADSDKSSKN